MKSARFQRGFTLVEAIVVMVITGILATIMAVFIAAPVRTYMDATARVELTDVADQMLRRMQREIQLSLPNSVRVSADGLRIEFVPVKTAARYYSADYGGTGTALDWDNPLNTSFSIAGSVPSGKEAIAAGDGIVIYELGPSVSAANAYTGSNRASVAAVSGANITLSTNVFANQATEFRSPGNVFYVVNQPVMYICTPGASGGGQITRYWNYGWNASLTTPSGGQSAVLGKRVTSCNFGNVSLATQRAGLVLLRITMEPNASNDAPITLAYQVMVDNTP